MRGTSAEAIERTESSLPEAAESFLRGNTSAGYLAVKRLADIVCALAGLILLAAPMLILSAIIVIDSPGPAIFRQERLGKNGKTFMILKFRTMRLNAEENGPQWAQERDPRCTRVGLFLRRSRLDELPQLFNILDGSMSLVGPRPERQYFYQKFEEYIPGFSRRLAVTPGLTGYAQVNGGYSLPPEEKIIYDMYYIRNQSLRMDLHCLVKTVRVVFTGNGAR